MPAVPETRGAGSVAIAGSGCLRLGTMVNGIACAFSVRSNGPSVYRDWNDFGEASSLSKELSHRLVFRHSAL